VFRTALPYNRCTVTDLPDTSDRATPSQARAATPLHVDFSRSAPAGLRFAFGDNASDAVRVRCRRLAGPSMPEAWLTGDRYRAVLLDVAETGGDIAEAARQAYAELIARVRGSSYPYMLRIWNYFGDINAGDGDDERYRRFCVGRAAAVDAAFNDPPPAATAIGYEGGGALQVIALCGREPGVALENPRQTPARNYPRDYGPVAPGFSRGALLDADGDAPLLLASGTASIVGHVSQHEGDVVEQLCESIRNLSALLAVGRGHSGRGFSLSHCEALRVYLRHPHDLGMAQEVIAASPVPDDRVLYLRGDVCRRELDVELEGVFSAS
jgi:chorismate lyase / 3-hydroxybenzoate synthase